jgi:hypothetical protein
MVILPHIEIMVRGSFTSTETRPRDREPPLLLHHPTGVPRSLALPPAFRQKEVAIVIGLLVGVPAVAAWKPALELPQNRPAQAPYLGASTLRFPP